MESKDRHKTVYCKFCEKSMLSNKLKRHMKTHKSFLAMSDEEVKEMLKVRHENQLQQDKKIQQVENIAQSMGIPADFCRDGDNHTLSHSKYTSL